MGFLEQMDLCIPRAPEIIPLFFPLVAPLLGVCIELLFTESANRHTFKTIIFSKFIWIWGRCIFPKNVTPSTVKRALAKGVEIHGL
jgi:hypothetical protein